jgi:hypothetical protein
MVGADLGYSLCFIQRRPKGCAVHCPSDVMIIASVLIITRFIHIASACKTM